MTTVIIAKRPLDKGFTQLELFGAVFPNNRIGIRLNPGFLGNANCPLARIVEESLLTGIWRDRYSPIPGFGTPADMNGKVRFTILAYARGAGRHGDGDDARTRMLDDDAPLWRCAPDTLLKALVLACEGHGDRLEAKIDALIQRGDRRSVHQPWGSSTTAKALKDPTPMIYQLRGELEAELPATLGKLLRLAQLEQQRQYIERSEKGSSPAAELATDLPARIKAALACERKAAMPAAALFHAAFTRAREAGLIEHDDAPAPLVADEADGALGALKTGFVLPPADFEKFG